jgi:hypothetical protein
VLNRESPITVEGWQLNLQSANCNINSRISTKLTRRNSRGNLAEFGPALLLSFAIILVPAQALIRLGCATAAMSFVVARCADSAATSPTYDSALVEAKAVASNLSHCPLWVLSGLKPGAMQCLDLYIDEQVLATGQKNVFGPDRPLGKVISSSVNTYEYEVRASFSLEPLFPTNGLPTLGRIPLLSVPAVLTATAVRAVEYPDGLTAPEQK